MTEARLPMAVRVLHWGIAAASVVNVGLLETGSVPHRLTGFVAVAMVITRQFFKHTTERYNPSAIHVYRAIWLSLTALAVTGWMMGLDALWGNTFVKSAHVVLVYSLGLLVCVHLAGVFLDALRFKRKTWMRMIDGR